MAIDRIGKGAPPAPPKLSPQTGPTGELERTFDVRTPPTSAPGVSGAATGQLGGVAASAPAAGSATPLERFQAGEIDLDGYLDLKVNDATAHVAGLRAHEMEGLRSLLREQLASDPALVELVQQATGQRPAPKE